MTDFSEILEEASSGGLHLGNGLAKRFLVSAGVPYGPFCREFMVRNGKEFSAFDLPTVCATHVEAVKEDRLHKFNPTTMLQPKTGKYPLTLIATDFEDSCRERDYPVPTRYAMLFRWPKVGEMVLHTHKDLLRSAIGCFEWVDTRSGVLLRVEPLTCFARRYVAKYGMPGKDYFDTYT